MTFFLKKSLQQGGKLAELLFFPSFCKICSDLLDRPGEKIVCRKCLDNLRPQHPSFCMICGRFFEGGGEPHLCQGCLAAEPPFHRHRSAARYRGELKDLLLLFKYQRYRPLGRLLARFAESALQNDRGLWEDVDLLLPVPLHPKKKRQRGFNQAELIAKEMARLRKIPLETKCLARVKNIPPQTSLEASEREKNVRGAFQVKREEKVSGKIVLLVDDVYTTGSTIRECCLMLKRAGAKEVRALTVAQA